MNAIKNCTDQWVQIWPTIISVIGTLLGTVLGWFLNNLSKNGRLNIYPSWKDEFQKRDSLGSMSSSKSKDEAEHFIYSLSIDIYNSCGDPKIMRQIEVVFFKGKRELFRIDPLDDRTMHRSGPMNLFDKLKPLTIPAKTVDTVKLHGGFSLSKEKYSKIWDVNKIMLVYRDGRNKEKRVLITKKEFSHYYDNYKPEE